MKPTLLSASLLLIFSSSIKADEISKKVCQHFLPAFSDSNILIYNNSVKKEFADYSNPKFEAIFKTYMASVEADVGTKAQENCNNSKYPVMDLKACYDKCTSEGYKMLPDRMLGWNVEEASYRRNFVGKCLTACAGAFRAQNTISVVLRKVETTAPTCSNSSVQVMDNKLLKPMNDIMQGSSPILDSGKVAPK
jgi:hypothetical protein